MDRKLHRALGKLFYLPFSLWATENSDKFDLGNLLTASVRTDRAVGREKFCPRYLFSLDLSASSYPKTGQPALLTAKRRRTPWPALEVGEVHGSPDAP